MRPVIICLFLCACFAVTASAKLYKWVDENGVTHFSNTFAPSDGHVQHETEATGPPATQTDASDTEHGQSSLVTQEAVDRKIERAARIMCDEIMSKAYPNRKTGMFHNTRRKSVKDGCSFHKYGLYLANEDPKEKMQTRVVVTVRAQFNGLVLGNNNILHMEKDTTLLTEMLEFEFVRGQQSFDPPGADTLFNHLTKRGPGRWRNPAVQACGGGKGH